MVLRQLSATEEWFFVFQDAVNDAHTIYVFSCVDQLKYLQTDQFSNRNTPAKVVSF
jgi:hypothetical protein